MSRARPNHRLCSCFPYDILWRDKILDFFFKFIYQQSGYIFYPLSYCGDERRAMQSSWKRWDFVPSGSTSVICSRSDGRVRFSLLYWLAFRSGWSVGFGCVTSFQWCLAYLSEMTSRTNGILKSSCRVRFVTQHGASVIIRRIGLGLLKESLAGFAGTPPYLNPICPYGLYDGFV